MEFIFRVHALQRMFLRDISEEDVRKVILEGEVLENYPDDEPYPSRLILGWRRQGPVHVVIAENREERKIIVVTAYEPDADKWNKDFRRRKGQ